MAPVCAGRCPKFIFRNHNLFDFLDVFDWWERVGKRKRLFDTISL